MELAPIASNKQQAHIDKRLSIDVSIGQKICVYATYVSQSRCCDHASMRALAGGRRKG